MDKKDKILESALDLIVRKGFHGTATSAIAKNADVSNGTLFHYYNSKAELIQTLHQAIKSEQISFISANVNPTEDPKEQLEKIWSQALNWAYSNKEKYFFLNQYKFSPYKKKHKKDVDDFFKQFERLVEKGIQLKQLRFMPAEFVFEMTNANVYGMINYLENNPVKYRTPEFMRQSFEWFYQGLKP